jgi:transcriptional regulator GlxA family with amidase domain
VLDACRRAGIAVPEQVAVLGREHACAGISVRDVLRHCPMARRGFESRLKALIGRTPREEITRVQISRVKELLNGTFLSLPRAETFGGAACAQAVEVSRRASRESDLPWGRPAGRILP